MPKTIRSNLSRTSSQARHLRSLRSAESAEEREHRLSQRRFIESTRLRQQTEEDRLQRLHYQQLRFAHRRASETNLDREILLFEQRIRDRQHQRKSESAAEKDIRLSQQRQRTAPNRSVALSTIDSRSAFNYNSTLNYDNISNLCIGRMSVTCPHCRAKLWSAERPGLCCSGGKVIIPCLDYPPEPLKSLILGTHPLSKNFLRNIRNYNTAFQMTSFVDREIREANYMPTFKIQGQVYHRIGSLLPSPGNSPQFLQIYFVSDSDQASLRMNIVPNLTRELTDMLQKILHDNNNYVRSFKAALELIPQNTSNFRVIIHSDRTPASEHRGRNN